MPVNTPCQEYSDNAPIWRKIRDVILGEKKLKIRGVAEIYLVKPTGFQKEPLLWDLYLSLAEFYPATRRTVIGLKAAIFRRPPTVDLGSFDEWAKSVTQDGQSLQTFAKTVTEEVIEIGRYGILVEFPIGQGASAWPYLCGYCAEAVINWRTDTVTDPDTGESRVVLVLVVLKEDKATVSFKDPFIVECKTQYRVLDLDPAGKYRQRVFVQKSDKETTTYVQDGVDVYPVGSNGEGLDEIPFLFVGASNLTPDVDTSPIEDLADVNLFHFKTSADLGWGCHLIAMPTPWVTGWDAKGKRLAIGSGIAWTFVDDKVRVGINEFKGDGLGTLERRLESQEHKMAKLGAMILKTEMKQPATAKATQIEHSGEASVLAMIAGNVGEALTTAANWAERWKTGKEGTGKVELNTEFYDQRLTSLELDSLSAAHQSGEISTKIYVYNLARGDMLPKDMAQEDAIKEIDDALQNPALSPLAKPLLLPGSKQPGPAPVPTPGVPVPGDNKQQPNPGRASNAG